MAFKVYQKDKPLVADTSGLNGVYLNSDQFVSFDSVNLESLIVGLGIVDKTAKVSFLDPGGRTTKLFEQLKETREKIYVEFSDMNTNIKLKLSLRKSELSFRLTTRQRLVTLEARISSRTDTDLDFPI